jgi:hypothetical protein
MDSPVTKADKLVLDLTEVNLRRIQLRKKIATATIEWLEWNRDRVTAVLDDLDNKALELTKELAREGVISPEYKVEPISDDAIEVPSDADR